MHLASKGARPGWGCDRAQPLLRPGTALSFPQQYSVGRGPLIMFTCVTRTRHAPVGRVVSATPRHGRVGPVGSPYASVQGYHGLAVKTAVLTRVRLSIRMNVAVWVGVQDMGGFLRWARLALGCVDEVPRQGSPWCLPRTAVQGRQHRQLVPSREPDQPTGASLARAPSVANPVPCVQGEAHKSWIQINKSMCGG